MAAEPAPTTETCPGCGAVLASVPARVPAGAPALRASASCTRLFEVTVRGLREEPDAAGVVRLADAAYAAQHPPAGDPAAARAAVAELAAALADSAQDAAPEDAGTAVDDDTPRAWRSTIADVAADLDVIDLPVLVETWARSVHDDWSWHLTRR